MLQVTLMGYASCGAFLGLAYFDLYYVLIAIMVICNILIKEQILNIKTVAETRVHGVAVTAEQADSDSGSLGGYDFYKRP